MRCDGNIDAIIRSDEETKKKQKRELTERLFVAWKIVAGYEYLQDFCALSELEKNSLVPGSTVRSSSPDPQLHPCHLWNTDRKSSKRDRGILAFE